MDELLALALTDPPLVAAIGTAALAPLVAALVVAGALMLRAARPSEVFVARVIQGGLAVSLIATVVVLALFALGHDAGEIELRPWLEIGSYRVPVVVLVDDVAVAFGALAAFLTALVARFSRTYLHKEPGFARYFLLLGLFAGGAQLVTFSGAFDLFFAGWELLGVSSMLFIGFYFERAEPVRSAIRAFATYRVCDIGFFIAIVATHELVGTTRLSGLAAAASLPEWERTLVAALFVLAALGKSAQLPFSSWLPRAMEGPTPSSALFYGEISVHAGLYLLLRVYPLLATTPVVTAGVVVIGALTAVYGMIVARVQPDAKGALAHATLAQTGLILAEIALGLTTLALVHIVGHALLRVWQYLRAPNVIHDAHTRGHGGHRRDLFERVLPTRLHDRLIASAIHRFRLDDGIDAVVAPVLALARGLDRVDQRARALLDLDGDDDARGREAR